ncbi:MAG: amidase domain-containing protein [Bacillota bacterium]
MKEIFSRRARWLLTGENPAPLEPDYLSDSSTAQWALNHEQSKIRSVRQWAEQRGMRIVEAQPSLQVTLLKVREDRARFYVAQSLALGYVYAGEQQVNRFGVGSRHIVELQRVQDRWVIRLEWYSDPLGDETEVPASASVQKVLEPAVAGVAWRGYDREKAAAYADMYCGLAAGCGNNHQYNRRYRDYSGAGGNCSNFASQALRAGGLQIPLIMRADNLVHHLTRAGRAGVVFRGRFPPRWKAEVQAGRIPVKLQKGDLVAYQVKGKMEHIAIVTGFDSRGYPLVNSHTLDRFHVPFDLGWDQKTVFWLLKVW